ncbi:CHAT domain-containing protein [Nocardia sp. NPDC051052]|uniref:CHAT domain-containing protein n=1 Tax=Nocardia sp. NPDC051052 TaxID=3364322 RepID=UPI0037AAE896
MTSEASPDGAVIEVLVRAADAGSTYLTWRWLDERDSPNFEVLAAASVARAVGLLDTALIARLPGETAAAAAARALTVGAFAEPGTEHALAVALTDAVLPRRLRRQTLARLASGHRIRFRVTPSQRLARIPWELLCLDDDLRLIEAVEIVYDPPATVYVGRSRIPPPDGWHAMRHLPALFVIDPVLPPRAGDHGLRRILDRVDIPAFAARLAAHVAAERITEAEREIALAYCLDRVELSAALRTPRSRLFYVGHISAEPDEPGSASLHLYDTARTWGMAQPLRRRSATTGAARADAADHLPLSALDLLLGTRLAGQHVWARYGDSAAANGADLWPMPPRVAMIACEGSIDYRSSETFGLVVAVLDAGAELVTTTRWPLPANRAFRAVGREVMPTSALALRVDEAHECCDPVADLAGWQREQLTAWRSNGDPAHTPLVWASISQTCAPARVLRELPRAG